MPSTTPLTDAINALTTYANETTGASDTTLSDAVGTLVAGYGGGGGGTPTIGVLTTITITDPVATLSYELPQLAIDYGTIWVDCDGLTLSAQDYMYFAVCAPDQTPDDNTGWIRTSSYTDQAICVFGTGKTVGNVTLKGYSGSYYINGATNRFKELSSSPTTFKAKLYASGTRFTAGTITIYGRTS